METSEVELSRENWKHKINDRITDVIRREAYYEPSLYSAKEVLNKADKNLCPC